MVNTAATFISSDLNASPSPTAVVSTHRQPRDAAGIVEKLREIPRRATSSENGYDGLAIVAIDCRNDGSPVELVTSPPAPQPGDVYHYASMIGRVGNEYDTTFLNV